MADDWSDVPPVPVIPNWSQGYAVTTEFQTSIFESRTGDEQRRAIRQEARKTIEFTAVSTEETQRRLLTILSMRRDNRVLVPDILRSISVDGQVDIGDDTLDLGAERPYWLLPGVTVFVWKGKQIEAAEIAVTAQTTVTFTAGLGVVSGTGFKLCPALQARYAQEQALPYATSRVSSPALTFEVDPGTEVLLPPGSTEDFRGQEIFLLRPNWRVGVTQTPIIPSDVIDYGHGKLYWDFGQLLAGKNVDLTFSGMDRATVLQHESLFNRMKGRRGSFYLPTWTEDFEIVGSPDLVNNEITVKGDYRQETPFDDVHRNICFISPTRVIPVGIAKTTVVAGGVKLKLDQDIAGLDLPARYFISWLLMVRFASDQLTVSWQTDTVAEIAYKVSVMRDGFFELSIAGHRIIFGGDYLTMAESLVGTFPSLMFDDPANSQYLGQVV